MFNFNLEFPYPWSDEIDEETVKNAIVALSLVNFIKLI